MTSRKIISFIMFLLKRYIIDGKAGYMTKSLMETQNEKVKAS
jgi:hypothetical protein